MSSIAEKLKQLRLEAGMSQDKLAEHLLVSRQAISKWENGETLPDMENMIALAKLYGTSLDELVGIAINKEENPGVDNAESNNSADNGDASYINADIKKEGENLRINLNGINIKVNGGGKNITINGSKSDGDAFDGLGEAFEELDEVFDNLDESFDDLDDDFDDLDEDFDDIDGEDVNIHIGGNIQIDEDGININNGRIKIDEDGININDGKIKIGKSGIVIDEKESESELVRILRAVPYPIITVIAFLLLGTFMNAWSTAWILFCTIPVYYSIVHCISKKRFSPFSYSVLTACIYLFIGMVYSLWHPGWIIFLTIPVYHAIASALDKAIFKKEKAAK